MRPVCNQFNRTGTLAVLLSFVLSASLLAQSASLNLREQEAFRAAANHVADSVVQIETFGGLERVGRMLVGTGPTTGLIISSDGYVVSSAFNFIQQPASILVTLPNGKRHPAKIVSRDRSRMIVLLKIEVEDPLPVPIAAPIDETAVGQWAVALGRTFSTSDVNISVGILSALGRIWGRAIQTDAKISPGNYGGPLVDLHGRVLGVLVPLSPDSQSEVAGAEWYDSGIGFAVPLADILSRFDQLKSSDLHAGILGVRFKEQTSFADPPQVAVVQFNSPAAEAGLEAGDVIEQVNGSQVKRLGQLKHVLGPLYAGDRVELVVSRGDERLTFDAVLTDKLTPYEHPFVGILPRRDTEQVRLRWVYPASPASRAGLLVGDVIESLENELIENAAQLRERLANQQPGDVVSFAIRRGETRQTIDVELGKLPEQIPDDLPPAAEISGDAVPAENGEIEIAIPEEPNKCRLFVPQNYDPRRSYGLLVSLHAPGSPASQPIIDQWRKVCEDHELLLLLPQANDARRWLPTEEAYVRKTVDDVMGRYPVDETRVVVHGYQGGAAMAYLVAFKHRDVLRGVVAIDAALPLRMSQPENNPLQRLAIITSQAEQSRLHERIMAGVEQLRELKFPVTVIPLGQQPRPLNDNERDQVGRWVDSLDRI